MEPHRVVAVLTEIGKAVRLFRYYAPSHPSVQRTMNDLAAALPGLARVGTVELRITPQGFESATQNISGKSEATRDLSQLLYGMGHRHLVLEPGITPDEVGALVRALVASGSGAARKLGAVAKLPVLPHIHLHAAAAPGKGTVSDLSEEAPAFARRSTGVFQPEALPPDLEARRIVEQLATTPPEFLLSSVARLDVLAQRLSADRDQGGLAEAAAALAGLAVESTDPMVRQVSSNAVQALATPAIAAGLVAHLADPGLREGDRATVVRAVASLGEAAVAIVLDAYLSATDANVKAACGAVVAAAPEAALAVLGRRVAEERPQTRQAAAALLGATGSAAALPFLLPLTADPNRAVRTAGLRALSRVGGAEAGRAVAGALRDDDPAVRAVAAAGLAQLGEDAAAPVVLARLLDEADDDVCCALAEAAAALRIEGAMPRLAELALLASGPFQRRAVRVRVAAVRALAALGTPGSLAEVARHKDDASPEVRAAARQALE